MVVVILVKSVRQWWTGWVVFIIFDYWGVVWLQRCCSDYFSMLLGLLEITLVNT